ncbi:DNA-binding MarR family transcriptional regulator [Roseivirga pacifica]|jgi:MarR family transcriptional regulator, organic hydroperoxide resistance regulator|uniref:DNA-binding transcriptional regulator, MarR family n=1 Tax=Roseivirga pacifica TaxID=1267423 RepID=A0A1I0MVJ8_9BACT|nr:MarR family transcriptional regulator [Roseivirga pacifica]MCO6359273.1 MarR family transcriptional regulator [Roseivirga pacifica]MCO6365091.1 MarR family transcriptional regulator [Roseivirga pacifica]MCO6372179.1 MarR family transcriptional regulator [Roseivirga pacifica]MCO6375710.1 MarR family transcriptional regulator [Roseivirga pacifica]MCO6379557.1 MarR family transcriptional regulator [Roseivirga pacifica]
MKREETVDHHIKTCWHAIYRMYNQEAAKHDSTTSQAFVVLNIDPVNGTPATKIAPLMGLESRSLTRMLKSMEEMGVIYKQKDPTDGRSVRIFLTDLGKEKRQVSKQTVILFNEAVKQTIAPDKLEAFFEVIVKINQLIESNPYSK